MNARGVPEDTGIGTSFRHACAAIKTVSVKKTSTTIAYADSGSTKGPQTDRIVSSLNTTLAAPIGIRHADGANVAWVDGHVSWDKYDVLDNTSSFWNRDE